MTKKALAAVLFVAARAHADPGSPAPIELSVTGAIDSGIVATSIASELARPVTPLVANQACHAPCLAIAITGTAATMTFTTSEGYTRQRTIELGDDRARWTEMITLLGGNLVREEASELLPDPAPTAPPPAPDVTRSPVPLLTPAVPPPAASALPPERVSPVGFGLVPGASTDLFDLSRAHWVSIGIVAGSSGDVRGLALSGAVDVAAAVTGLQLSGAVAVAGDLKGVQIAGAVTVADHSTGAQIAGAAAIAKRSHVQIAGAVTEADDADLQIAGGVAVSHTAATQVAGGVNFTGRLTGFQLAPINIARRNEGVQLGVINIGGGPDGDSFGLINIVPGGRTELEATLDSDRIGTVILRHGGRHWHNVYGVGGQSVSEPTGAANNDVWMFGAGLGPTLHAGTLPVDLEAMAWHVDHGGRFDEHLSMLDQLRLTIGVPVGPVALVAGGALNVYISDDHSSPFILARTSMPDPMATNVTVKIWPSLFVGARI
jgi:hypothetical protein